MLEYHSRMSDNYPDTEVSIYVSMYIQGVPKERHQHLKREGGGGVMIS